MTRIFVLGANSFAGSAYVAHALKGGADVVGVNRSPEPSAIFLPYRAVSTAARDRYRFRQADVNTDLPDILKALEDFRPEVVVDFAGQGMVAESWAAPEQWYQTNVVAKARLHSFLKDKRWLKRYIRISTPEVYGSCEGLITEAAPYNPSTPYAVSHAATDMSLRAFHAAYDFPVIIGRFSNFFGEHQQLYRIVPKTVLCLLTGKRLPLHGGGTSVRSFVHASDAAAGIEAMIARGQPGGIYHFSTREFVTIRELVERLCAKLAVPFADAVEVSPDRIGKDHAYLMDAGRARAELDWAERVTLDAGLDRTIDWVKANRDELVRMPWTYVHKA